MGGYCTFRFMSRKKKQFISDYFPIFNINGQQINIICYTVIFTRIRLFSPLFHFQFNLSTVESGKGNTPPYKIGTPSPKKLRYLKPHLPGNSCTKDTFLHTSQPPKKHNSQYLQKPFE